MSDGVDSIERVRALLALYRATHYDVEIESSTDSVGPHPALFRERERGSTATLRVGAAMPPAIATWLGASPFTAFMTACNPRSQALAAEENGRRLATLRAELDALGASILEGAGRIPGEDWREASVLVCGITLDHVDALAVAYEQNAVVVARPDRPATLRLYRSDWRALLGAIDDIEWCDAPHTRPPPW